MNAMILEVLEYDHHVDADSEYDLAQPKQEKFRQSLGKVYRARAAERRHGRPKTSVQHRRSKKISW